MDRGSTTASPLQKHAQVFGASPSPRVKTDTGQLGAPSRGAPAGAVQQRVVSMNPQWLAGPWNGGWALDLHTVSSTKLPDDSFNTKRTDIGELLYQLKYRQDSSKAEPLAEAAARYLSSLKVFPYLAAIVPIPPSQEADRKFQPVPYLAVRIGQKAGLPYALDYLEKLIMTGALKGMEDLQARAEALEGAFAVADDRFAGSQVLLFDDLYRSGQTLSAANRVLKTQGKVSKVFVLTLTKTRTKR